MRILLPILFNFVFFGLISAQSTAYVIHFGPTAGLQKWDNSSGREPLFQYHAALSMETINNEENRGSFYMQLGYHVKGSATRYRFFNLNSGAPGGTLLNASYSTTFPFHLVRNSGSKNPIMDVPVFLFRWVKGRLHLQHKH
jgi:hypothetical protein